MDTLFTFLTMALTSNNLFGGMGGAGGAGGGAGGGGFSGSMLTGSASAGNPAAYGTMAVGGVLSAASAIKNFSQAEDFEDGLIDTFRDPTFTAGLGTTIGGAVGGPIGGAIGGALGSFVPTVSEALENWLCSTVHDPEAERLEAQTAAFEDACKRLEEAATAHETSASKLENEVKEQQSIFNDYDDNQKRNFLLQQGYTKEQIEQLITEGQVNQAFDDAVKQWVDSQNATIENERLLKEGASGLEDNFAKAIGVDNASNWSKNDSLADMVAKAKSIGLDYNNMSDKELAQALTAYDENIANKQLIRTESGYASVEKAKTYAANLGKDVSTEEAMKLYLADMNAGYSQDDINKMAAEASSMEADKSAYDDANSRFHKRLKTVMAENPNIVDYSTLLSIYSKRFSAYDIYNAIDELSHSATGDITINGSDKYSGTMPNLRYKAFGSHYEYDPSLYEGKFMTGLDYVPIDNFLALLHQGEMVLNKSEADTYRNSFDATAITNSVDTQTDKLIEILTKIMQLLTYRNNAGSNLPRSLVNMNSDIALL